jgi:hypothetical protein
MDGTALLQQLDRVRLDSEAAGLEEGLEFLQRRCPDGDAGLLVVMAGHEET